MSVYLRGLNNKIAFVAAEASFGTVPGSVTVDPFVAADAVRVISAQADVKITREKREDYDRTRTNLETVATRKVANWSMECYMMHGSGGGTPPDNYLLMNAGFGSGWASGSEYVYALTIQDTVPTFSMLLPDQSDLGLSRLAKGCIVDKLAIKLGNDKAHRVTFSGRCQDVLHAVRVACPGGASAAETTITLTSSLGLNAGAFLTVGSELIRVDSIAANGTDITVSRAWGASSGASIASAATLTPWLPSSKTLQSFSPKSWNAGGNQQIGGVTCPITTAEITIENNHEVDEDIAGVDTIQNVNSGPTREVSASLGLWVDRDTYKQVIDAGVFNTNKLIALVIGATAGTDLFNLNMRAQIEMPELVFDGPGKKSVTLSAMGVYSTAEGELSLIEK